MFDTSHLPSILISYVALLFALSVHEASHATSAYLLGDDTARRLGRMTLNPVAHMDMLGTVVFPLMGLFFGGFFIGWAKPVPFNPANFRRDIRVKTGDALVSFAGPFSNLVQSLIFLILLCGSVAAMVPSGGERARLVNAAFHGYRSLVHMDLPPTTTMFLALGGMLVQINILLAFFNLLPLGPLDGAGVLRGFIPDRKLAAYDRFRYHPGMMAVLMVLMFIGILGFILRPVMNLYDVYVITPIARLILGV